MNHITNLRTGYTVHNYAPFTHSAVGFVREANTGYQVPHADVYARRIAERAEVWLEHARERSRMKDHTLVRKALQSVAFTLRHRAHDLAIPTKLVGVTEGQRQRALWQVVRSGVGLGTALDVEELREDERIRLVVSHEGARLGEVQRKHAPWVAPIVPFGAAVYLVRVTGTESDYTLGCNIAIGRCGSAVAALRHALGHDVGGDGHGGDGAAGAASQVPARPVPVKVHALPEHGGDGLAADPEDVVLYRGIDGTANATVDHVVRHSPSGVEWGYRGSGPADLARSILLAFTDEATADRNYVRFKEEVVASVPRAGGVLRATAIRTWLARRSADSR